MTDGLLRATLTLLAGGALAQALPLLLGPWLTRLYSPSEFGIYHLFSAVAANLAVVACARYEFALPLAADDREADLLRALCLRLLAGVTLLTLLGALVWAFVAGARWPLCLPMAVALMGALSLATLWATRAQRFRVLGAARVLQQGGGAALQGLAGLLQLGTSGLIVAPLVATAATLPVLGLPLRTAGATPAELRAVARRHLDFPLLNTPHAFAGALQDTLTMALIAHQFGVAAAGSWGLALRYLKAPATLIGGALSQALYPRLAQAGGATPEARVVVRQAMLALATIAVPLVLVLWVAAPDVFAWTFGECWRGAGDLARALALYIGVHFVASPLAVVTMAWGAQAWALKLALLGQVAFVAALALGLQAGSLVGAAWVVSGVTTAYFGWYFLRLATWPVQPAA